MITWSMSNTGQATEADLECIRAAPSAFLLPIIRIIAINLPIIVIIVKHWIVIWLGIYCSEEAGTRSR